MIVYEESRTILKIKHGLHQPLIHLYFEYITVAQYTIRLDQVTFHNTFTGKISSVSMHD